MATNTASHTLAAVAMIAVALPAPATAAGRGDESTGTPHVIRSAYGWPVKPFDRQHPVRGFFGDPRMKGSAQQFHFGVDVSAPNGTPVYATISGGISFIHEDAVRISAGAIAFEYWHIVPVVRPGQQASAYRTLLGFVEKPLAHVHFSESRGGVYVNPLRPGAMGPFSDFTQPQVTAIHVRANGDVLADVLDETPFAVPAPWADLPVMPAVVRWRLEGGRWETAADFRRTIPAAEAFFSVYAKASRPNHANTPGLYRIWLAHGLRLGRRARVQVLVEDAAGNESVAAFRVAARR